MIQVLPVNDLRKHDETTSCWCDPKPDLDQPEIIVVHNSADGRELIEQAEEIAHNASLSAAAQGEVS